MALPTPTPPKQGVRARERNALERISSLENDLQGIVHGVQSAFNAINQQMGALNELLNVVVNEIGPDVVNARLQEMRDERAMAQAEASKNSLETAVKAGQIKVVDIIEDDSILTGVEKDKDGQVVKPGYVQLRFADVLPDLKEKLKGQVVGFVLDTPVGGKFEVTGIYQPVPQDQWPKVEPTVDAPQVEPSAPVDPSPKPEPTPETQN